MIGLGSGLAFLYDFHLVAPGIEKPIRRGFRGANPERARAPETEDCHATVGCRTESGSCEQEELYFRGKLTISCFRTDLQTLS